MKLSILILVGLLAAFTAAATHPTPSNELEGDIEITKNDDLDRKLKSKSKCKGKCSNASKKKKTGCIKECECETKCDKKFKGKAKKVKQCKKGCSTEKATTTSTKKAPKAPLCDEIDRALLEDSVEFSNPEDVFDERSLANKKKGCQASCSRSKKKNCKPDCLKKQSCNVSVTRCYNGR